MKNLLEQAIERGDGAELYRVDYINPASGHGHTLRLLAIPFPDGAQTYVELSEPGKVGCDCVRRVPVSELAHLLMNITDDELLTIPNRDNDARGHAHHPPASVAKPGDA